MLLFHPLIRNTIMYTASRAKSSVAMKQNTWKRKVCACVFLGEWGSKGERIITRREKRKKSVSITIGYVHYAGGKGGGGKKEFIWRKKRKGISSITIGMCTMPVQKHNAGTCNSQHRLSWTDEWCVRHQRYRHQRYHNHQYWSHQCNPSSREQPPEIPRPSDIQPATHWQQYPTDREESIVAT